MIQKYYRLTKPGIIYGNLFAAVGAFFLASHGQVQILLFLAMTVGLSLVIGSACVFNNYLDRNIDAKMKRTKGRALVTGQISMQNALLFGTVLGLLGTAILYFYTNLLTTYTALIGFVFYVVFYGYAKRKSVFGAEVGSISGAVPPVVGYTAVSNTYDLTALFLFLILVFWQMPHFFAIALYRKDDYASAAIPVHPIKRGHDATKRSILLYTIAYVIASIILYFTSTAGIIYLIVAIALGVWWLYVAMKGFGENDIVLWGKKMFRASLLVMTLLFIAMTISSFLLR